MSQRGESDFKTALSRLVRGDGRGRGGRDGVNGGGGALLAGLRYAIFQNGCTAAAVLLLVVAEPLDEVVLGA